MKKFQVLFIVLLGVSFLNASSPKKNSTDSVDWTKVEKNYIVNLKSENDGVKSSAASYVRKYKLSGAVDELKSLLTNENAENVKMSAALALVKVGGTEGRTAVTDAMKEEENEIMVEFYQSILQSSSISQQ